MDRKNLYQVKSRITTASDVLRSLVAHGEHAYYILPIFFLRLLPSFIEMQFDKESKIEIFLSSDENNDASYLIEDILDIFKLKSNTDIGRSLSNIFKKIEKLFPSRLDGAFGYVDFSNHRLGSVQQREDILREIISIFSPLNLKLDLNENSEIKIGELFENAISILAGSTKSNFLAESVTPMEVATLIGRLMGLGGGRKYYDPACGTGSILSACVRIAKLNDCKIELLGQERNGVACAISKMNLFLTSPMDAEILLGDALRSPLVSKIGDFRKFDVAVSNPPWNVKEWSDEFSKNNESGMFGISSSSKVNSEWAFMSHMLDILDPSCGQLAVIVPGGALFRSGNDALIRRWLIEENFVDCVIALPPRIFFNTEIPAYILILKYGRVDKNIFFIDGSDQCIPSRNKNYLSSDGIDRIIKCYTDRVDSDGFAASVPFSDIFLNDFDLLVSRYVSKEQVEEIVDLNVLRSRRSEILSELQVLRNLLDASIVRAENIISKAKFEK